MTRRDHGPRCRCRPPLTAQWIAAQLAGYALALACVGTLGWLALGAIVGDPAAAAPVAAPDTFGAPYWAPEPTRAPRPTATPRGPIDWPELPGPDPMPVPGDDIDCSLWEDTDELEVPTWIYEYCDE